jgi:hypothetical protein
LQGSFFLGPEKCFLRGTENHLYISFMDPE